MTLANSYMFEIKGENEDGLGTLSRVDEPTPTNSLPEELVPPFSPVSNFIDQVNDDGSGIGKLYIISKLRSVAVHVR